MHVQHHTPSLLFLLPLPLSLSPMIPKQITTMLPLLLLLLLLSFSSPTTSSNFLKLPLYPLRNLNDAHPLSLSSPIVSAASLGSGQYLAHLSLGSPPQPLRLIADTGSDLIWSHCSPCLGPHCLPSKGPAFLPRLSSSFSLFHCFSPVCRLLPKPHHPPHTCHPSRPPHSPCRYLYSYADGSFSSGLFSRETTTFSHDLRLHNLRFGCSFNDSSNNPTFNSAHGVLGLGRGPISFSSQAGKTFGNTFSYCLMDYTISPPPTSYLLIGSVNFSGLSFTPLESNPLSPTFYYIRVVSAAINSVVLPIHPSVWAIDSSTGDGGMIVDTGTTLSFFPEHAYKQVVKAMRRAIPKKALVAGPFGFDLCVNSTTKFRLPRLSLHLQGGAKMTPPPRNYLVAAVPGVSCLALQAASSGFGVIGNLMQQGFLFVFDRDRSRLGFSRRGCDF